MTHKRPDYTGFVVHVFNRRVDRQTLFLDDEDYLTFQELMEKARLRTPIGILEWCLMPNHWHMALEPPDRASLPRFMHWLCGAHATLWRERHRCVGEGSVYQGRYKAVPVQDGEHLDRLLAYIAWNPVEAGLCQNPAEWRWGSAHRQVNPSVVVRPQLVKCRQTSDRLLRARLDHSVQSETTTLLDQSIAEGVPWGEAGWVAKTINRLGLQHVVRGRGRPRQEISPTANCP